MEKRHVLILFKDHNEMDAVGRKYFLGLPTGQLQIQNSLLCVRPGQTDIYLSNNNLVWKTLCMRPVESDSNSNLGLQLRIRLKTSGPIQALLVSDIKLLPGS